MTTSPAATAEQRLTQISAIQDALYPLWAPCSVRAIADALADVLPDAAYVDMDWSDQGPHLACVAVLDAHGGEIDSPDDNTFDDIDMWASNLRSAEAHFGFTKVGGLFRLDLAAAAKVEVPDLPAGITA